MMMSMMTTIIYSIIIILTTIIITTGKYTVPILWDKKTNTIVNNESSEILRMLNGPLAELNLDSNKVTPNLYPQHLQSKIDKINDWIYHDINNGVYKSGFARTQDAYVEAVTTLFNAIDRVESILFRFGRC